jgi:hypothetical protein
VAIIILAASFVYLLSSGLLAGGNDQTTGGLPTTITFHPPVDCRY